jgi:hypothetical protein
MWNERLEILSCLELFRDKKLDDELEERIKEYFAESDDEKRKYLGDSIKLFVAIHEVVGDRKDDEAE